MEHSIKLDGEKIVLIGGGDAYGRFPFGNDLPTLHLEERQISVGERLRGDIHLDHFREPVKGRESFRYIPYGGVPGAVVKRAKRKAAKKARKASRK